MTCEDHKCKNVAPWIASVAISILCCSILFVLFASFLVDIKVDIKESNTRLGLIEQRQDALVNDIEVMRKHVVPSVMAQPADSSAAAVTPTTNQPMMNVPAPPAAQPSVTVPVMPATPETK